MSKRTTQLALLSVLFLLLNTTPATAQVPNLSGTWLLSLEKSKLESKDPGFTGSTFIIEQKGDKISLTRIHYFGEKKKKIHFLMTADGKTRRIKLLFKGKLEKETRSLLATLWRNGFSNVVRYSFGENESMLIADEVMKSKAENHHNIWVFDKKV